MRTFTYAKLDWRWSISDYTSCQSYHFCHLYINFERTELL